VVDIFERKNNRNCRFFANCGRHCKFLRIMHFSHRWLELNESEGRY
jgi:hypothetical protein